MEPRVVLLVEDNSDDVALIKRALYMHEFASVVVVARDGAEALSYFFGETGEQRPMPALAILDLRLPKVDGLEVLARLRADERTALLPVVVLTSSRAEQDLIDSYRNGANGYVRKPVDFAEFVRAARVLGVYWLSLNVPPSYGGAWT